MGVYIHTYIYIYVYVCIYIYIFESLISFGNVCFHFRRLTHIYYMYYRTVLDNILNGYFNLFLHLHCLIAYKIDDICILTYIHNNHDKFLHYF